MIEMGAYSYSMTALNKLNGRLGDIIIGKFCSIAHEVGFYFGETHSQYNIALHPFSNLTDVTVANTDREQKPYVREGKYLDSKYDSPLEHEAEPIVIRNDVWIAQGARLLEGATIDNGAIVGAFSVVAGYVEPYALVVGNPAKMVRKRFDEDEIQKLLEIRWWDWPVEIIKEVIPTLRTPMVTNLVAFYNKYQHEIRTN